RGGRSRRGTGACRADTEGLAMVRDQSAARMRKGPRLAREAGIARPTRNTALAAALIATTAAGCAHVGRMHPIAATVAPTQTSTEQGRGVTAERTGQLHALFG